MDDDIENIGNEEEDNNVGVHEDPTSEGLIDEEDTQQQIGDDNEDHDSEDHIVPTTPPDEEHLYYQEEGEGEEEEKGDKEENQEDVYEQNGYEGIIDPGVIDDRAVLGEIPDTGEAAEIILITTSLGSIRRAFYGSKRAQNLLDCKDIVYFLIDSNLDMSKARNLADFELFKSWKESGILLTDPNGGDVLIPQIIIDGVAVGGEVELENLEADGDLDWTCARAACPGCLHEKGIDCVECPSCGIQYRSLIPEDVIENRQVIQILRGEIFNDNQEAEAHFLTPQAAGFQSHGTKMYDEMDL